MFGCISLLAAEYDFLFFLKAFLFTLSQLSLEMTSSKAEGALAQLSV